MVWPIVAGAVAAAGGALALYTRAIARGVEAMVPPEGRFADVEGARIHYVDRGDGPAIVMIHGILAGSRNFTYTLVEALARDHRVIAIDRPGWGHSRLTGPRPGPIAQARMIGALIDMLQVERPLIVGHSMGGAVSLAMALAQPGRARGYALIAPFTQPIDTPPPALAALNIPPALAPAIAWTIAAPMGRFAGPQKLAQVFAPELPPSDYATRGGGALTLRPQAFEMGVFEMRAGRADVAALAPRYGTIADPVAILYPESDALLDPALHGRATAAAIPGATIRTVPGGHMLPITQAAMVEAWLREADPG